MHYYPFNIADFNLHTAHLTLEEEAVYRRLIDFYYDTESPIPKETQPVIRRLRLGSYVVQFEQILSEFFTLEDDGWHSYRCDIEIKSYHDKGEIARLNGKKGGRPRKNKGLETQPVILANPDLTQPKANQELRTKNHELSIGEKAKRFVPPELLLITNYFTEKGSSISEGDKFFNFYESNGWKVGKNKMKCWKSSASGWISRNGGQSTTMENRFE